MKETDIFCPYHTVVIHHLVCKGTMDERVMTVLQGKNQTQSNLLEALKTYLTKGETT